MTVDIPGFLYGGAVAAGGIMGYYKAGSIPSLAAGLLFGGILIFGAVEASKTPANYNVQLAATSILTGVMGYRYYSTGKMVPGVVTLLSLGMLLNVGAKAAGLTSNTRN